MLKQCESVTLMCAPSMPQFAETPLWACEACDDEDVPTSSASERKVSGEDAFNISWCGPSRPPAPPRGTRGASVGCTC